ncbi:hypothetical protein PspLS_00071 [Pyricularia sp. CBS 133598]|nr:hypothetical protein PspLS_00071 [Pyricularia sp. CBS 133598]
MLGKLDVMDGIDRGMDQFSAARDNTDPYRVPGVMLLTDSSFEPDDILANVSYITTMRPLSVPIHTFGFGYKSESGQFKAFSEISGGSYTFIPDPSMIGTVFIHTVANIRSTAALGAHLTISGSHLKLVSPFGSTLRWKETPLSKPYRNNGSIHSMRISLGSIRFGQSRDIYLAYERPPPKDCIIQAKIITRDMRGHYQGEEERRTDDYANLPAAEVAYHVSRAQTCRFISTMFPIDASFDGLATSPWPTTRSRSSSRPLPRAASPRTPTAPRSWPTSRAHRRADRSRWPSAAPTTESAGGGGGHYLLGLLDAHTSQVCHSYKDEGPLRYGRDSPLFEHCRDALNAAFDNIEPPQPSIDVHATPAPRPPSHAPDRVYKTATTTFSSAPDLDEKKANGEDVDSYASIGSRFNRSSNPCFPARPWSGWPTTAASCPSRGCGAGMSVATPARPRAIHTVLKTRVRNETMVRLPGGVVVTPWHPVKMGGDGAEWRFPAAVAAGPDGSNTDTSAASTIIYSGFTY